jgi:hypothetical protein
MMSIIYEPLARLAVRHPFWFSLHGGVLGSALVALRHRSIETGLVWGSVLFVVMLACWMPPYGPLRRLLHRYWNE